MEKAIKYLTVIPLIALAILPPIFFDIPIFVNSNLWFWVILLSGLLGILFLYTRADLTLKIISVYLFINCFTSKAPYLSFNSYVLTVSIFYYYLLCLRLNKFEYIVKAAQALFFLNIILIVSQLLGGDKLLNFGRDVPVCFGTIGNPMWLASFLICLTPFLLLSSPLNIIPLVILCFISKSSGMALSLAMGGMVYGLIKLKGKVNLILATITFISIGLIFAYSDGVFKKFKVDRGPIWKKTVELTYETPLTVLTGWGIGTYKVIVPALTEDSSFGYPGPWEFENTKGNWLAWRQAHNCWLQILFEAGYIGLTLLIIHISKIFESLLKLPKTKEVVIAIVGAVMISTDMLVHYPTRMMQSVLIIICFLAYCKTLTLKGGVE